MEILPVFASRWRDDTGYEETSELLGYKAVDALGQVIALGESREEAIENALEAQWPIQGESDAMASTIVAR